MRIIVGASVALLCLLFSCVNDEGESSSASSTSSSGGSSSGGTGGPAARSVQCNDKVCATGEVCCLVLGGSSVTSAECKPEAACATAALLCDNADDCNPGQVCCVSTNGGSVRYGPSSCAAKCEAPTRQLCREAKECASGSCAPPQSATTPTNLKECK